jgi:hypothetical protein
MVDDHSFVQQSNRCHLLCHCSSETAANPPLERHQKDQWGAHLNSEMVAVLSHPPSY